MPLLRQVLNESEQPRVEAPEMCLESQPVIVPLVRQEILKSY